MGTKPNGLIHVAGVIDLAEAELLIDCGVAYLGFPLVLDHHTQDLTVNEAASIVSKLGDRATFFAITYLNSARDILDLCRVLSVGMVQLHGETSLEQIQRLREQSPTLRIIKSLIVRGTNADALIDEVQRYEADVDIFITDTFDPETGASGATGRVHDWEISRRLVETSSKPVILAGGLNASNVRQAIRHVRPAGVDVHTGIEAGDGRKCADQTKRFVEEARAAFAEVETATR
jgi:phosphoribosylanthranilate isomerase